MTFGDLLVYAIGLVVFAFLLLPIIVNAFSRDERSARRTRGRSRQATASSNDAPPGRP